MHSQPVVIVSAPVGRRVGDQRDPLDDRLPTARWNGRPSPTNGRPGFAACAAAAQVPGAQPGPT
jgi:hypothetical protein